MTELDVLTEAAQDPKFKELIRAIIKYAESKGEEGHDLVLELVIGLMAQASKNKIRAIANLEVTKHTLVATSISYTVDEVGGALRKAGAFKADESRVA